MCHVPGSCEKTKRNVYFAYFILLYIIMWCRVVNIKLIEWSKEHSLVKHFGTLIITLMKVQQFSISRTSTGTRINSGNEVNYI